MSTEKHIQECSQFYQCLQQKAKYPLIRELIVVYLNNGTPHNNKKEPTTATCINMNESHRQRGKEPYKQ